MFYATHLTGFAVNVFQPVYATWNSADNLSWTLSNGNLTAANTSGSGQVAVRADTLLTRDTSMGMTVTTDPGSGRLVLGVCLTSVALSGAFSDAGAWGYANSGNKNNAGSGTAYGATYTGGDFIECYWNASARSVGFKKNGSDQGVAFTGITAGNITFIVQKNSGVASTASITANFGATTPANAFTYAGLYV